MTDENGLTKNQKMYLPVKRCLDIAISIPACIILIPVMLVCAAAIKIDSPGPVLFRQKRIGKDKTYFNIWKFRTMRTDTPKDVPTHLLSNPESYITKTGRFMRKYSVDELPQIYQILLTDKLSWIGPRPALWNQNDLVEERDKYGVNEMKPGITGWAQINGRDELEIPDKARLDGEYVRQFGLWMDIKCFLGTIGSVLCHDGVKEGGTGEMHRKDEKTSKRVSSEKIEKEMAIGGAVAGIAIGSVLLGFMAPHIRRDRDLNIDRKQNNWKWIARVAALAGVAYTAYTVYVNARRKVMLEDNSVDVSSDEEETEEIRIPKHRNILISGADSYIGTSVESWMKKANGKYGEEIYKITTLDMQTSSWGEHDFSRYDVVYHVAGIAHADVGKASDEEKQIYYKVNTELAVEVARKAKSAGVKQFIFMSSMLVYSGCGQKVINRDTEPKPLNFYGDSKLQADQRIQELRDESFKVVVLRPPMIYGKSSKGNYSQLAKLAGRLPVFPIVRNSRSMLYIENLCQFVKLMIDNEESGVFFPQNGEYTNTSDMVQMIAAAKGHRIVMLPGFEWAVKLVMKMPGKIGSLAEKAFGDYIYEMCMSGYKEDYAVFSLCKSIRLTEGR